MAPGERMITIPGFGDHVRADWPITINGMRIYGAAVLFFSAIALLGASLFRFGQEVRMGLSEADHYR
jgi:hypothetical protein